MSSIIKISSPATSEFWELPVLYQDEHLLALSKPPGLAVAADSAEPSRPSLLQLLHSAIKENKASVRQRGLVYLMNVFRIDDEASGLVLFARSKEVLVKLSDHFGAGAPGLRYWILCLHSPREAQFEVDARLAPDPIRLGVMRVDPKHGKKSTTRFTVLERFSRWTLLEGEPNSLRPHQLRAHLRYAGFPVLGDRLYGGKQLHLSTLKTDYRLKPGREERPLLNRAALHAESLALPHPVTGESLVIHSPLAKDMAVAVKYLRRYVPADPNLSSAANFAAPEAESAGESHD
jgi:RluA family pseudouridine synthase